MYGDSIYFDRNKKKIIIFFETDSYDLVGWSVTDQLHNLINFSINIFNWII